MPSLLSPDYRALYMQTRATLLEAGISYAAADDMAMQQCIIKAYDAVLARRAALRDCGITPLVSRELVTVAVTTARTDHAAPSKR